LVRIAKTTVASAPVGPAAFPHTRLLTRLNIYAGEIKRATLIGTAKAACASALIRSAKLIHAIGGTRTGNNALTVRRTNLSRGTGATASTTLHGTARIHTGLPFNAGHVWQQPHKGFQSTRFAQSGAIHVDGKTKGTVGQLIAVTHTIQWYVTTISGIRGGRQNRQTHNKS